jgi:formylglycine-generating enzyme required for sulfatase activity
VAPRAAVAPGTLRVPQGFRAAPGATGEPYSSTGWAEDIIHEASGIEMAFIPAGEFLMGAPGWEREGPQHRVRITHPFYMGKYEVTQGQWQAVMGSNPSNFKGDDRLPVEMVSWNDCQEFLGKLNALPPGGGFRLPTEAEWEYACRAGTSTHFCFGDTISTDQANYAGKCVFVGGRKGVDRGRTTPVGSFPPNPWGLYDMHGNVWEWCEDRYGPYEAGPAADPQGPPNGELRVLRGGAWNDNPADLRSARRLWLHPTDVHFSGLRVAAVLE